MWWYIALFIVSYAIVYATRPNVEAPKAAGIDEFQLPTADADREIPVLFGTKDLNGPNVVFYGHLRVTAITKKQKK
jgi:hypothetical protein